MYLCMYISQRIHVESLLLVSFTGSPLIFFSKQQQEAVASGVILVCKDVKKGERLGDAELQPELGAVVVVEDRPEGVLLQRVIDLPRRNLHLCREARLAGALLVLPRRRIDVCSAKARSLNEKEISM